jgi:hypothetical protein
MFLKKRTMTFWTYYLWGGAEFSTDITKVGERGLVGGEGEDKAGSLLGRGVVIVGFELALLLVGMDIGEIVEREVGRCVGVGLDDEHGSAGGFVLDITKLVDLKGIGGENIFGCGEKNYGNDSG